MGFLTDPIVPVSKPWSDTQVGIAYLSVLVIGVIFVMYGLREAAKMDPMEKAVAEEEIAYLKANGRDTLDPLSPLMDDEMLAKKEIVTCLVLRKKRHQRAEEECKRMPELKAGWDSHFETEPFEEEVDELRVKYCLQDWIPGKPETAGLDLTGKKTKYWMELPERIERQKKINAERWTKKQEARRK